MRPSGGRRKTDWRRIVLGLLLARGTLLSFFLVVTFLPAALLIFDKLIAKTTWHAGFFRGGGQLETEKEADA